MYVLTQISRWAIPVLLFIIPFYAYLKKVNVYEVFVEGAQGVIVEYYQPW
jgi:spore maturation protein B